MGGAGVFGRERAATGSRMGHGLDCERGWVSGAVAGVDFGQGTGGGGGGIWIEGDWEVGGLGCERERTRGKATAVAVGSGGARRSPCRSESGAAGPRGSRG